MSRWRRDRRPPSADAEHPAAPTPPDPFRGPASGEAAGFAIPDARVVLITRQGCHLCVEAASTIHDAVASGLVAERDVVVLDVDSDPALRQRFTDHVPVVFVDQRLLTYWTLSWAQLTTALTSADWPSPPAV